MKSKQFYTYKFNSSRLKEFKYNINLTFEEGLECNEVIALFDNQILRSIRDITNKNIDDTYVKQLHIEKNKLNKEIHSTKNQLRIKEINNELNHLFLIPEYITIVMDHPSHYKYLFENGLWLNGKRFIRFNSSAGQARVSTVTFCDDSIIEELNKTLDNGRDESKKLVPSKYNAYKGVYGSATQVVTTPRLALVPDYFSDTKLKVNFVTETELPKDDLIDEREITESFNRFDGQGLISYEMASQWAEDLGLDYVPAQWCVRNSFCKGMLNTFPIHQFCEEKNKGNYEILTSYKDSDGNRIKSDLRNVDVILSESMLKLWDSFPSIEVYQENCDKNNLKWGVSLFSPKKDKNNLKMNYQFLQTLNLNKEDIKQICSKFVKWITGVTSEDIYYTFLFLLGTDNDEDKIKNVLNSNDKHWMKALVYNPDLINDKYIKKKIYDLMKHKIQNGCLGSIIIDGNFQTLVSDPYAMMEHVCGLEVKGLLGQKEYYSNYWNKKNVKVVDSMRAPLTYRSEHLLLNLVDDEEKRKWYRYNYTGIIVNAHGAETMHWAGSDFDYDILATTSDETVINSVYQEELPIVYEPPKSEKYLLNDELLYKSDVFSFGSAIGSITNKSTTAYALLPTLDEDGTEYKTTMNRIKMCTKLQSAQIDKAKIGREVKGIPVTWTKYQRIHEDDSDEIKQEKNLINNILLDKHPYFFIYLYKATKSKYSKHLKSNNITCQQKFGMTIDEMKLQKRLTLEQKEFLDRFEQFSPVLDSDCVMNNICKYIESIDFGIRKIMKDDTDEEIYTSLLSNEAFVPNESIYKKLKSEHASHIRLLNQITSTRNKGGKNEFDLEIKREIDNTHLQFKSDMLKICSNEKELVDHLIYLYYKDLNKANKDILWNIYGENLVENIKAKTDRFFIPVPDEQGEITYLNDNYTLKEVLL